MTARAIVGAAAIIAAALTACTAPAHGPAPVPAPTAPAAECSEDMACWDCSTMGNRICGPTAPTAPAHGPDAACMAELAAWNLTTTERETECGSTLPVPARPHGPLPADGPTAHGPGKRP